MSYIQAAFELICTERKEAKPFYVILVENVRCYGGPEEGGWWYDRHHLVEYQEYPTEEIASEVAEKVKEAAKELSEAARTGHGDLCLKQLEWLDARGLDADYLPENDGPAEYSVYVVDELPVYENKRPHYC